MIQTDLDQILDKVDCRYTLVVEVAKRARQLVDGTDPLTESAEKNPVSQATKEVENGALTYIRRSE